VLVISNSCSLSRSLNAFEQVLGGAFLAFEGVIHVLDLVISLSSIVLSGVYYLLVIVLLFLVLI
jgi:hypothetical protein